MSNPLQVTHRCGTDAVITNTEMAGCPDVFCQECEARGDLWFNCSDGQVELSEGFSFD